MPRRRRSTCSFAEALAEELRREPVDVLALCPGATRSAFGARAGYRSGDLPGSADPQDVAAHGLAALGRQSVFVAGLLNQAALGPVVLPRRLVTGAVGLAMRLVAGRRPLSRRLAPTAVARVTSVPCRQRCELRRG